MVGSGYGGGVAASRLARIGLSVAVLERGREYLPGEFAESLLAASTSTQINTGGRRVGPADALFDVRVGKDVHALVGCGLGGTSLFTRRLPTAGSRVLEASVAGKSDRSPPQRGYHRAAKAARSPACTRRR